MTTASSKISTSLSWPPQTLTLNPEELINECELMEVYPDRGIGRQNSVPIVEMAALLYVGDYIHARHLWRRHGKQVQQEQEQQDKQQQQQQQQQVEHTTTTNEFILLRDWWNVCRAMMTYSMGTTCGNTTNITMNTIWDGLQHIQTTHPYPLNGYSKEVGIEYRKRIILQNVSSLSSSSLSLSLTQPYLSLLNFTSNIELQQFCNEHTIVPGSNNKSNSKQQQQLSNTNDNGNGFLNTSTNGKTSLTQIVAFLESTPWNVTS